ncbi:EAL domain-containing protein [Motilimonas cestriensis]|uniref:EAL domain-containing protein n=1 Tax=Motilimonas cestriensis TaxID=2742685 RepID=A0ABS8WEU7_9GAMM|nr:bifunctional diguanylate cyclase/phosphodiesterase [Motilimonas cestriensis]MCE2596813.1 EAL domain-containing protein [Motilimonas cestriensis]
MKEYKHSLIITNAIILVAAIAVLLAIKLHFTPLIAVVNEDVTNEITQAIEIKGASQNTADQLAAKHHLSHLQITDKSGDFTYMANTSEGVSLLFKLLFPSATDKVDIQTATLSINYINSFQTISSIAATLFYQLLILFIVTAVLVNWAYFRLIKNLEKSLVQEVSSEDAQLSTFSQVTEQLLEQRQRFHQVMQEQQQKIQLLAKQVNMDNLTGLNNRHAFRKELTQILSSEGDSNAAILALVRASELHNINQQRGYQQGDIYLSDIGRMLVQLIKRFPECQCYRISGSDFALLAPNMTISAAQKLAKTLKHQFDEYQALHNLESVAYTGLSAISSGQLPEQVLARADIALAKSQTEGVNAWAFEQSDSNETNLGQLHWKKVIEEIIETRAVMLLHQPIQAIHRNMKGYQEIFTRFVGQNNAMIPTETVFAMAQRMDLIVKLEQVILETMVSQCRHKTDGSARWGVNISATSLQNSAFIVWLERLLLREPNIAASMIFEFDEEVLDRNLVASKRVFDMLKRTGSRSAISKFGKGIGSFRLFKELKPDFVKVDAGLISNIERDSANQQFLRMIVDVAHRMGCQVIAEGVEHLEQKQLLENMYVDGLQGFLISRPTPLSKVK